MTGMVAIELLTAISARIAGGKVQRIGYYFLHLVLIVTRIDQGILTLTKNGWFNCYH